MSRVARGRTVLHRRERIGRILDGVWSEACLVDALPQLALCPAERVAQADVDPSGRSASETQEQRVVDASQRADHEAEVRPVRVEREVGEATWSASRA